MRKSHNPFTNFTNIIAALYIASIAVGISPLPLFAADVTELQQKINEKAQTIRSLEQEIVKYQTQVNETSKEAKTLSNTVKVLDTSRKELETGIKATETKIEKTNLTIEQLNTQIKEKEERVKLNKQVLAESLRQLSQNDSESMIELMLRHSTLGTVWNDVETLGRFQSSLQANTAVLLGLKSNLEKDYSETTHQKLELVSQTKELSEKKTAVEVTKKEKDQLLAETKNKEANYKKILQDKVALKNAFEKEMKAYESELHILIDPKSLPKSGSGVLTWPLDKITITQTFGDTEFSRQNTGVYSGNGHNGVDFGIPVGSKVKAAAGGVIKGFGDTDTVCPKASYGKWVMIEHDNGLSTLYAHLSVITVTQGQKVSTGDSIGFSGNTGYSTGPHLHFTVYASQGVQIISRKSLACGGTYTMPVADLKAYLNPLLYL